MSELTQTVIPISLGMVKVFLIKGRRPMLIDAGNPGNERKILDAIAANGVNPNDLSLIVITHCHSDHFGSLAALQKHTHAKIAIHKSEADALSQGQNAEIRPISFAGKILMRFFIPKNATFTGVRPDILIDQGLDLHEFGIDGKVMFTPGHTPGSVSVILQSGEAIIGDLVNGMLRATMPNLPMFATDVAQLKTSVKRILAEQPTIIHVGHGGPFAPELVKQRLAL